MAIQVPILDFGTLQARLDELLASHGEPPWAEPLVLTDEIQAFLICQPPGHACDTHYHQHDEWWVLLKGGINWYIEDRPEPIRARAGDFVLCPKYRWHHLEPVGTELTVRIAIDARGEFHRYDRPGCRPLDAPPA